MTNILNSLASGGYEQDIDVDFHWVPDIECQYDVYWQSNGIIFVETFTVFENDNEENIFQEACDFAKSHNSLVFYREPDYVYFNPVTGEEVYTPHLGMGIDYYARQEWSPAVLAGFTAIDTDDLPF